MSRTKIIFSSLVISLLGSLLAVSTIHAANNQPQKDSNKKQTTDASVKENRKRKQSTLEERVASDKKTFNKSLSSADQTKTKNKCKAAQNKIAAYQKQVVNYEESRRNVYQKIIDRLESLASKLDAVGKTTDAATVKSQKAEMQNRADVVYAAIQDYAQALSDLSSVDCSADPTAFQAVLEASRTARQTVQSKAKELREYYSGTVTKVLSDIKSGLAKSADQKEAN